MSTKIDGMTNFEKSHIVNVCVQGTKIVKSVEFQVNKLTKEKTLQIFMFTQIHQLTTHLLLYKTTCTHLTPRHLSTHTSLLSFTLYTNTSLILHTTKWDPLLSIYTSLRASRTFLYNGKINSSPSFQHILVYGSLQIVVSCRDFQRDKEFLGRVLEISRE